MALTNVEKLRIELADTEPGLYILDDDTLQYFLDKNSNSVTRAMLDAAKTILLKLSQRGDENVDIFSIKGTKAAEQYRLALQLYLRDPSLNPILKNVTGWVGGVSLLEMQANRDLLNNNTVNTIAHPKLVTQTTIKYF